VENEKKWVRNRSGKLINKGFKVGWSFKRKGYTIGNHLVGDVPRLGV